MLKVSVHHTTLTKLYWAFAVPVCVCARGWVQADTVFMSVSREILYMAQLRINRLFLSKLIPNCHRFPGKDFVLLMD